MGRPKDFKPLDGLSLRDFEKHPVWGFDLELGESVPEADETWVRPISFLRVPPNSDSLFIRAELTTSDGARQPGLLCLQYEGGKPDVEGIALMVAEYVFLGIRGDEFDDRAKDELRRSQPEFLKALPLSYAAKLLAGPKVVAFSGTVRKPTPV
jgi:hypothetical protein